MDQILHAPADIKNNVGLNVTGGDGAWGEDDSIYRANLLKYFQAIKPTNY